MRVPTTQPTARRTSALCLAGLAFAVVLAGCGGASASSERTKIRAVLSSFLFALAHGDGTVACAHATPSGQNQIVAALGPELQNFDIYGCTNAVYVTGAQMKPVSRRALETARVATITLDGAKASIPLSAITSPHGDVAVELGTNKPVRMVDSYGVWLIVSL